MLPIIKNIPPKSKIDIRSFGGINRGEGYEMGELSSAINTDLSFFPSLGIRKKRRLYSMCDGIINGVGSYNGFFYTYYSEDKSKIFLKIGDKSYEFTSYSNSDDFSLKRCFAAIDNAILIIPDKVVFYISTESFINTEYSVAEDYNDTLAKLRKEGSISNHSNISSSFVTGWVSHNAISTSSVGYANNKYESFELYCHDFGTDIKAGDYVFLKLNAFSAENNYGSTGRAAAERLKNGIYVKIKSYSRRSRLTAKLGTVTETVGITFENNSIDVGDCPDMAFSGYSIEKKLPDLSSVCSYNNRIWGIAGAKVHTSKLGSANEWNDFSTDSYGILPSSCFSGEAGTDGDFTAIEAHNNYIYAFKENYIHKIYGDTPAEYTISNLKALGCLKDTDTLCMCSGFLMYASVSGICILKEGYPGIVSKKIGKIKPVSAASYDGRYFCICDEGESRLIYVYDLAEGIWTSQSCGADADNLCSDNKSICYSEGGKLIYISENGGEEIEKNIKWQFSLKFKPKYFTSSTAIKAVAMVSLGNGSAYSVRAIYDDGTLGSICGADSEYGMGKLSKISLPIKGDIGFRLEFSGVGDFTLKGIRFEFYKSYEE